MDKQDFMPKSFSSISLMWQITAPLRTVEARLPARLQIAPRRGGMFGWCWAQSADLALLASSQMFASDWYVRNYPDVPAAGIDPAAHYLSSGAAEGRNPSPHFSTVGYLDRYPDVAATGTNPLLHYLQHAFGRSGNGL